MDDETNPKVNVRLNIRDIERAQINGDTDYNEVIDEFSTIVEEFNTKVFRNGLQAIIDASKKKGMSGTLEDIQLLSYVMAGRLMITFKRGDDSITFLGADGEDNTGFYVRSIDATLPSARSMVDKVIEVWNTPNFDHKANFTDASGVNLGF